jgi:quinol monooxygenase YgiN
MAKPAILAKLTAQDGKRDELVAAFGQMMDHVRANEAGTEVYVLHTDDADPNVVWFYEMYTDDSALGAHSTSDTMKSVGKSLAGLVAGRPEIIRLTPQAGKGLTL